MHPTPHQIDALKELINIGVGKGAGVLNTILDCHVTLHVPFMKIILPYELKREIEIMGGDQQAAVSLGFKGNFSGTAELIFSTKSASKLVNLLTNDSLEKPDLDSVRAGTLSEIGNIVLNGVMGSISNFLKLNLSYSIPRYTEKSNDNPISMNDRNQAILIAQTYFSMRKLEIEGNIILLFEVASFNKLLLAINRQFPEFIDERA